MMYDALGYPPDHPQRAAARASIEKLLVVRTTRPIASPACRRCGTRRSPAMRCWKSGGEAAESRRASGPRLAAAAAGARRRGRLGRAAPRRAAGRLGVPIRQPALSRPRRHRGRRHGDGPRARGDAAAVTTRPSRAAREWVEGLQSRNGGWGAFDADNSYHYLNHIPVRRPRRAARSADRRRDRALRLHAGAARRDRRDQPGARARRRMPSRRTGGGRQLVRPLGHELHLRHLVGALRAQRGRGRSGVAGDAAGGRVVRGHSERGRRLGRRRRELQARLPGLRAGAEHGLANRVGPARA